MKRLTLAAAVISLVMFSSIQPSNARTSVGSAPGIGQPAAAFKLEDLKGRTHSLADYRGKITVVTFISAKCPVSNDYNTRIQALSREYAAKGVSFLAINANSDEPREIVEDHATKQGFTFTILKDLNGSSADAYGAVRTPEVFVVDAAGVLRYHGRIDNSRAEAGVKRRDVSAALDEMIAGKNVSTPETKAFGCPITRGDITETPVAAGPAVPAGKVALLKPEGLTKLLAASKGQVLLINFWATWCSPCVAEFPEFVAFDKKYRDKGVKVIGISADEVSDLQSKVVPFVKEQKVEFDIFVQDVEDPQLMIDLIDKKWEGAIPATFIYDRHGKLSFVRYGIIDRAEVTYAIEAAMKK